MNPSFELDDSRTTISEGSINPSHQRAQVVSKSGSKESEIMQKLDQKLDDISQAQTNIMLQQIKVLAFDITDLYKRHP